MPTFFTINGYRYFFVSFDCEEPTHVHVEKDKSSCKFWLPSKTGIWLAWNKGFSKKELNVIISTIVDNFESIKTQWNEHCKGTKKKSYNRTKTEKPAEKQVGRPKKSNRKRK